MKKQLLNVKKHSSVSQFTTISAIPGELKEKVFLKTSDSSEPMDVSEIHIPLCLNPLIIGIIFKNLDAFDENKKFELSVVGWKLFDKIKGVPKKEQLAIIHLQYFDFMEVEKNIRVILFAVEKSRLFQLNKAERLRYTLFLYLHYLKIRKRNSISYLNNLAALYSYPRKVVLNIIKTDSHFNIFPMDLVCELDEENIMVLGLNIKNRSIEDIIKTKKMLIVYPDASSKNIVYGFAGNHKRELLESDFPIKNTFESETFNFPVPNFASAYKEISCFNHIKLGSHYLLICRMINKKTINPKVPLLYNISSIHQLHLEKQNNSYPAV